MQLFTLSFCTVLPPHLAGSFPGLRRQTNVLMVKLLSIGYTVFWWPGPIPGASFGLWVPEIPSCFVSPPLPPWLWSSFRCPRSSFCLKCPPSCPSPGLLPFCAGAQLRSPSPMGSHTTPSWDWSLSDAPYLLRWPGSCTTMSQACRRWDDKEHNHG